MSGGGPGGSPKAVRPGTDCRHVLICVKRASRSAPLSHLFSQAIVAAEAIVQGDETWHGLLGRLPEPRRAAMPRRPDIVFAIQLTKGSWPPTRCSPSPR
jgi:uncharacterized protein (TIGR04141 family)